MKLKNTISLILINKTFLFISYFKMIKLESILRYKNIIIKELFETITKLLKINYR
jgi:hypothetical protein